MYENPFEFASAAVVGNGSRIRRRERGAEIDGNEKVFRFHSCAINGFEKFTGTKTTDHVNSYYRAIYPIIDGARPVCPLPLNQLEWYTLSLKFYDGGHDWHQSIRDGAICQPWRLYDWLLSAHNHPSTGLALLWWIYHVRPERLRGVTIYGFDFFKPDANGHYHYWEPNSNGGHDGEREKKIIFDLLERGGGKWI